VPIPAVRGTETELQGSTPCGAFAPNLCAGEAVEKWCPYYRAKFLSSPPNDSSWVILVAEKAPKADYRLAEHVGKCWLKSRKAGSD